MASVENNDRPEVILDNSERGGCLPLLALLAKLVNSVHGPVAMQNVDSMLNTSAGIESETKKVDQ